MLPVLVSRRRPVAIQDASVIEEEATSVHLTAGKLEMGTWTASGVGFASGLTEMELAASGVLARAHSKVVPACQIDRKERYAGHDQTEESKENLLLS